MRARPRSRIGGLLAALLTLLPAACIVTGVKPDTAGARRRQDLSLSTPRTLSPQRLQSLVDRMHRWVESEDVVGAELLIVEQGRAVLHETVGWRNREQRLPVERDTICRIRSMTKPVVGTAVLMLVEDRKLSLDDPISRHLPSFDNERSRTVTVRQLLEHTGGFLHPGFPEPLERYASLRSAVDAVGAAGPTHAPGSRFCYSDAGSATLGTLIAELAGEPVESFIQRRILDPLGLEDTFCNLGRDDPRRDRVSCTYRRQGDAFVKYWDNARPQALPFFRASGGMYSTPRDYARFLSAILHGGEAGLPRLLSEETLRLALTPTALSQQDAGGAGAYGLHWQIFSPPTQPGGLPHFGHTGSDGTLALALPERDVLVLYFTQSRGGDTPQRLEELLPYALEPE